MLDNDAIAMGLLFITSPVEHNALKESPGAMRCFDVSRLNRAH